MIKRKRLLWQPYPSYLLITFISLVAVIWFSSSATNRFFLEQYAGDLESRARLVEGQIPAHLIPPDSKAIDQICKMIGRPSATRITVILPSGLVVGDSEKTPEKMDNHIDRPEVIQSLSGRVGMARRYSHTLHQDILSAKNVNLFLRAPESTFCSTSFEFFLLKKRRRLWTRF